MKYLFGMKNLYIDSFIIIVLSVQLAVFGLTAMDSIGIHIPLLRAAIGFFYLTFIPGLLILGALKIYTNSFSTFILYSTGLSLTFVMFLGFLCNTFFPLLSISKPISELLIISAIGFLILVLCGFCHKTRRTFPLKKYPKLDDILSVPTLSLCTLPILAIFGTRLVNLYNINFILILLIVIIALIWILIGFDLFIPQQLYLFTIFVVAISLLYHKSLISNYLMGADIHGELYLSKIVIEKSLWDTSFSRNLNAMLSIVMLAPIYQKVLNIDLIWIFKFIYPFIFSLVPVSLFNSFKKYTNPKIAIMSCLFFVSTFIFYGAMSELPRQQIAEFFLVMIIWLLVDGTIDQSKRKLLLVLFVSSLSVSHYGLTYIFLFMMTSVWILLQLYDNSWLDKLLYKYYTLVNKNLTLVDNNLLSPCQSKSAVTTVFIMLFMTFSLTWYITMSSSSTFITIVNLIDQIISNFITDFLRSESTTLDYAVTKISSRSQEITRILYFITQFFIVFGIFTYYNRNCKEYYTLSVIAFFMIIGSALVSHVGAAMGFLRLYFTFLTFLSPICICGGMYLLLRALSYTGKTQSENLNLSYKILSIFFMIFFIFNSGLTPEIVRDESTSISLNNTIDYPIYTDFEYFGASWMADNSPKGAYFYGDTNGYPILQEFIYLNSIRVFFAETEQIYDNSFVFLRSFNIKNSKILGAGSQSHYEYFDLYDSIFYEQILKSKYKIYSNGYTQIYR